MTNGWIDIKNTDMMLIMGGNPAENHPCGFKWAIEAKRQRNAKMIVVDPRFTRTAAVSDLHLQIRAGSDIAFLGGVIHYAIENQRVAKDYLVNYTNAAFLLHQDFKVADDGVFSGFNAANQTYDKASWNYQAPGNPRPQPAPATAGGAGQVSGEGSARPGTADAKPPSLPPDAAFDVSLQNPDCVYQQLKKHYSRYTPEMVERITGIPKDQFLKAADLFTSIRKDGDLKKVGTIIYAVGWTQHSFGSQIIRTAAMLQLLLGNVGRAGGGVNALRGHSNIQGATDVAGIFDNLPGYLKVPIPADQDFGAWMKRITPTGSKPKEWDSWNYWSNTPKFAVSFMKTMYGDAATKQNDWAYNYLPKVDREYSWVHIWDDMYRGKVKGLLAFGMNGVSIGPNSQKNIDALKKADWLVVCDIYPDETSGFWQSPGITPDEMKNIKTEVYRLPGAGFAEKDGTFVNSARWLQWKWAAVPPPGDAKLDQEILARIFLKVRDLYKQEGGKFPDPILNLTWPYVDPKNPSLSDVAKELNGRAVTDFTDTGSQQMVKAGQQLAGYAFLRDDGSTASGNWIWCGSWTEAGALTQRRNTEDPSGLGIYPNWAWSWPMNRRVLYNRASCDLNGKPWDADRRQIWWNEGLKRWVGEDVPDFKVDSPPKDHMGPFIMNPEGTGRIFVPLAGMADGPFPEHYEPFESPIANPLHPQQSNNPVVKKYSTDMDKYGTTGEGYTIVCTTYRLTEHYHYWTKNNPMNVQLVPEMFVEIPVELANDLGIRGGERVKVTSARATYVAKAMVTRRIRPMTIDGKKVYQIGLPIHQGFRGIQEDAGRVPRSIANLLSPTVTDPNAYTPEFKGFLVKLEKA
ncbi:MAG TPA: formate dehydrogenase-N subunit alpha [Bryobacteraceae bacterium]|nr:formate dehydrogenase-N subunit alpha [Bryobacteraceae bacterium]